MFFSGSVMPSARTSSHRPFLGLRREEQVATMAPGGTPNCDKSAGWSVYHDRSWPLLMVTTLESFARQSLALLVGGQGESKFDDPRLQAALRRLPAPLVSR